MLFCETPILVLIDIKTGVLSFVPNGFDNVKSEWMKPTATVMFWTTFEVSELIKQKYSVVQVYDKNSGIKTIERNIENLIYFLKDKFKKIFFEI